jgi:hypothetical protein
MISRDTNYLLLKSHKILKVSHKAVYVYIKQYSVNLVIKNLISI